MRRAPSSIHRRRRLSLAVLALSGLGMGLGGCATQGSYDDLRQTNRTLQEQNLRLQQELESCRSTLSARDGAEGDAYAAMQTQQREIDRLRGLVSERDRALADFERMVNEMDGTRLDPVTDRALADLAARYPNLISYDADRGMLRFASDLTFGSGSDALSDQAKRSIRQLAEVLKGAGAQYDVDIVGHTDNVPIGNPATRERHPTNMHLSVHRAISVRNELRSAGVTAEKMRASGWGEHRPIVANNPSGGTVQNRRVEIYLTRGGWTGPSATPALASPERRTEPTRQQPTRTRDDADIVK